MVLQIPIAVIGALVVWASPPLRFEEVTQFDQNQITPSILKENLGVISELEMKKS